MPLLSQNNRDLKRDRVWVWSLPAWLVTLPDGRRLNTCPSAGVCAKFCYALKGTYRFSNVRAAHMRNLERVLDDLEGWTAEMTAECTRPKMNGAWVRIHDAGDFFSDEYLEAWLTVARAAPGVTFYCYTKEIERFRRIVEPNAPANFNWVYSKGGKWDHLIGDDDRACDVFPDAIAMADAGYHDQADSDKLAVTGPARVGIVINNHPGAVKALNGRSLGEMQANLRRRDVTDTMDGNNAVA